jgi:hypothetical protein
MTMFARLTAAALVAGGIAAPAAAQYPYQQPYPQPYPQTYPPGYGYQNQGYNNGGIGQIIDQLLGNRYNVSDRNAVSRCASAAVAQARARYMPQGYGQGYGQGYQGQGYPGQGYPGQGYNGYNQGRGIRVTAITNVERRSNGLRVRGLLDSRGGYNRYQGQGYSEYQGQGYNNGYANGDLTFRCNVDYRGVVTNLRIERNSGYRPY